MLRGRGVTTTDIPCPMCEAEGNTTIGGYTPRLSRLADGADTRLFCLGRHGYLSDQELSR
jgi:hypothetical protein